MLASAALHAGFVLVLVLFATVPRSPPAPVQSIVVDLVTPGEIEAALPRQAEVPSPVAAAPPPLQPAARPDAMLRATRLYSEEALAQPKNRLARLALPTLAPDERMEQLCGIEAMDQVHAWKEAFEPDRLVAYAMAETIVAGNVIHAEGAAFRSDHRWYNLRFDCELSADRRKVAGFAFKVGEAIPPEAWEAHDLPAIE